ncbi:MAG: hypothetical protein SGJ27_03915 [Candidatus Melainabacteria bacterium]|nr:hypothetical protein [Candidatus Melainabacteria bacterium]
MKKSLSMLLAAVAIASSCSAANAEDAKEMARNAARFPVRAAAVGTGMVVGIPVAITRRSSNRAIEFTESFADKIGGKEHAPPMIFASILGMPFGLLVGAGEGVFMGGKNAINGSAAEHPFTLSTFSLDEELE